MQFHFENGIYKVVRITGPTHNFLGLAFLAQQENGRDISVEPTTANTTESVRLDANDVRQKVLEGVREANAQLRANYRPSRIQYVPTDSAPADVYRLLARRIIERLHHHPESYRGTAE